MIIGVRSAWAAAWRRVRVANMAAVVMSSSSGVVDECGYIGRSRVRSYALSKVTGEMMRAGLEDGQTVKQADGQTNGRTDGVKKQKEET